VQAGLSAPVQGVSPLKGDGSLQGPSDSRDVSEFHMDLYPLQDEPHNSCRWQHHSHLSFFLQVTMYT
jgi:hypothetical protein